MKVQAYNNITALTDTESDYTSGIWLNGDKIVCNDSEVVTVNGEFLHALSGCVDESQSILLARSEIKLGNTSIWCASERSVLAWVVHLAIDQVVVREGNVAIHGIINNAEIILVIPIREYDGSNVFIVA